MTAPKHASPIERVKAQTSLPMDRAREVFSTALRQAESATQSDVPPVERAVMIATERLWAEEKAKRDAGA